MYYTLKTLTNTLFKAAVVQASELPASGVVNIALNKEFPVAAFDSVDGHYRFTLGKDDQKNQVTIQGKNTWYVFAGHVKITQKQSASESGRATAVGNPIIWTDSNCRISKHFTVREVTNNDTRRIPTNPVIVRNILLLAKQLDAIREAWNSPIGVTSWYRPVEINRAVGGVPNSAHVQGYAADIYPMNGDIWDFQNWLDKRWTQGGLGYGATRGFVHLDLATYRRWDY